MPDESTSLPQRVQLWGWQIGAPSLRAHDIFRLLSSSFRPKEGMGKAFSQSDAFFEETARSLALSFSVCAVERSKSNICLHIGMSHSF